MTRDQIIHNLFTGKNFTDCIGKMEPQHLQEDLKQEVILVVCEMPEEKIVGLYQRRELDFFVARIILNQIKSNRSPFYKKFRQAVEEITGNELSDAPDEYRQVKELIEDMAMAEIKAMEKTHWYAYELIQLYIKHQNFRAIETETRIPFISCYKTIKKALDDVRQKVYSHPKVITERINYIKCNPIKS